MITPSRTFFRILGAAHISVAVLLLPVSTFFGMFSLLVVVPVLFWLATLGVRLWKPSNRLRIAFRFTHLMLAPFAILLVVYGVFALRAAQRSAEGGGRLLGAFGFIPIVMGLLAGSLSVISLIISYSATFQNPAGAEQDPESGSARTDRPHGNDQKPMSTN